MTVIYIGKNHSKTSMYLVAQQIAERTGYTIATKVADLQGVDVVLNLCVDLSAELLAAKRFVGYKKLINLIAGAWDDLDSFQKGGILNLTLGGVPLICHSPYNHNQITKYARARLNGAMMRKLGENLYRINYGISDEFVHAPKLENNLNWIVPYNRSIQKNVPLHNEVTTKVSDLVDGFNTLFILNTETELNFPHRYTLAQQGDRAEFVERLKNIGGFLCTSTSESFGIYFLELMATGAIGVFLDCEWVRLLLPNYPLIGSKAELTTMMLSVINNYDHWQYEIKPYVEDIQRDYRLDRFCVELKALCTQLHGFLDIPNQTEVE